MLWLQDDMKLAPDFFTLFNATAPLLDRDPSLFCVSSWNDHGQARFVKDPLRLLRSDFFPGLGWMLTRDIWDDIKCASLFANSITTGCPCALDTQVRLAAGALHHQLTLRTRWRLMPNLTRRSPDRHRRAGQHAFGVATPSRTCMHEPADLCRSTSSSQPEGNSAGPPGQAAIGTTGCA